MIYSLIYVIIIATKHCEKKGFDVWLFKEKYF